MDIGPLKNLPYHPVYPFTTLMKFKSDFTHHFPKEAYLLLWSLDVIFEKIKILKYLVQAQLNNFKRKYLRLSKWLELFGDILFPNKGSEIPLECIAWLSSDPLHNSCKIQMEALRFKNHITI